MSVLNDLDGGLGSRLCAWLVAASWQLALFIALVALAAWLLRRASPHLRYALWMLVLIKAIAPPWLGGPWSVGAWGVTPLRQQLPPAVAEVVDPIFDATALPQHAETAPPAPSASPAEDTSDHHRHASAKRPSPVPPGSIDWPALVVGVWAAGVAALGGWIAWCYARLRRVVARLPSIDEGPLRVALEKAAMAARFGDAGRVDLRLADQPTGPFLFGVRRPTVVLAAELPELLGAAELQGVLTHELMHWRRRDTWVGWAQTLVQTVFWFHPFVWWAGARLREEREKSCDDDVLRLAASDTTDYGEAIVRSLTIGHGRPLGLGVRGPIAAAGMVGVFERGCSLQERLEDVMSFNPARGAFGWRGLLFVCLFAMSLGPMASRIVAQATEEPIARLSMDQLDPAGTRIESDPTVKVEGKASTKITTKWPTTVCLAEVVAPDIEGGRMIYQAQVKSELDGAASLEMWAHLDGQAYFSRNPQVSVHGDSDWKTLNAPFFFKPGQRPEKVTLNIVINGKGSVWVDDVQLLSKPIPESWSGASASAAATHVVNKTLPPESRCATLALSSPMSGETEVDPSTKEIRVTFDRDMTDTDYSWTSRGKDDPAFPSMDKSREVKWVDKRTCVLPVLLKPRKFYRVGLNSKGAQNFKDATGRPAAHTVIAFTTKGAKRSLQRRAQAPGVKRLSPADGATDVDPSLARLKVTFDSVMGKGMSWTKAGGRFPETAGGKARWSDDGRTCSLPVELQPGTTYTLGLNHAYAINFQSRYGVPLPPAVWTFTTADE